jgi:hypothetical protein
MIGLLHIDAVHVPVACLDFVFKYVRTMGGKGMEGIALWAGRMHERIFEVQTTIIPTQTASQLESGLLYSVGGSELHRINQWLYENNQTLIAQLHSHPGKAYHSEMDDRYPVIATLGGLSVVIPDFGFSAFSLEDWAIYRLSPQKIWTELTQPAIRSLIQIQS